jgi:uncharacterized protein (TIGR02300 family)
VTNPFQRFDSVPKPDLGGKHQCLNCSAKFFDLHKDPIVCPKCGTIFQPTPLSARAAARAAPQADDDEVESDAGAELVPLEEADADEDKVVAAVVDDDADEIEDETPDDTFLEEEEDGDDDVSDLIDGDIESDEER